MTGLDLPTPIPITEVPAWADEAEIVIVGFGMAGACAAIEARAAGADVLLLERGSGVSGTTTNAAGHFYLGGGTPVQRACGFQDTAQDMIDYLTASTPDPASDKIRLYCEQSVEHFHWLEAHGVPFDRSYYPFKSVVQPTRDCLIWTGNEKVWPYREQARAVPRGHKVAFDGEEGGGALAVHVLSAKARELGARVLFDTRVRALIVDETGRVVGIRATVFDEVLFIRARKAVMLAAGGFGMNAAMVARYVPALAPPTYVQGGPNDDGASILLGMSAGGAVRNMEKPFITCPFYPPEQLLKGILVNKYGKRFVAEDSYHSRTAIISREQADGIAYLILDSAIFAYPRFAQMMNQQLVDGFETIEEMERGLNLPEGALVRTMADYNAHAARGEDPEFHKYADWIAPLTNPPYAAFDLSVGKAVYTGFTLGGLAVSVDAEVLTESGAPIPGLYAAGACASNIAQDSRGYSSGTCIGEASFFGRRGGRHAAALDKR
jgi:succinate dehydrogenase/fumarate reductase flavoprotein subunit